MITKDSITRYVDTLEDEELLQYTIIPVKHWIEFYHIQDSKSVIKWDNLGYYIDLLWAVFSVRESRYYLRSTRSRFDHVRRSKAMKTHYNKGNLYKLLTEEQLDSLKIEMRRVYKHYTKKEGTFKYRDYYRLITLIIFKDEYYRRHNHEQDFKTVMNKFDTQIKLIIDNN